MSEDTKEEITYGDFDEMFRESKESESRLSGYLRELIRLREVQYMMGGDLLKGQQKMQEMALKLREAAGIIETLSQQLQNKDLEIAKTREHLKRMRNRA